MKIVANLELIRQEWDPSTREHRNTVVLSFLGATLEIPVPPEIVAQIVRGVAVDEGAMPEEYALEEAEEGIAEEAEDEEESVPVQRVWYGKDDEEEIFGGELDEQTPVEPPKFLSLQQEAPVLPQALPKTRGESIQAALADRPSILRRERHTEMRKRAKDVPQRRVSSVEGGYPAVSERRDRLAPTVVQHHTEISPDGDDDGFAQG